MPNILCPKPPSLCNDPADPLANISSEAPDGNDFTGRSGQLIWPAGYGGSGGGVPATADTFPDLDNTFPETWPPLGNQWTSSWCNGVCISDESQDAADLCAWNASVECDANAWPELVANPDPATSAQYPYIQQPQTIYWNDLQQCTVTCPDGSPFTYTVQPNQVSALSQVQANYLAYYRACMLAAKGIICFAPLPTDHLCLQDFASVVITVGGRYLPMVITYTSGTIPPGMILSQEGARTITMSGTPTTGGSYSFTLTAFDAQGSSMTKTYSVDVYGISNFPTDGVLGVAYSFQFLTDNMAAPVTFVKTGGSLPDGLTLSSTGEISGTPTSSGSSLFQVTAIGADGKVCGLSCGIDVSSNPCLGIAWSDVPPAPFTDGGASQTVSVSNCTVDWTATAPGPAADIVVQAGFDKTFQYTNNTGHQQTISCALSRNFSATTCPGAGFTGSNIFVSIYIEDLTVFNSASGFWLTGASSPPAGNSSSDAGAIGPVTMVIPAGHTISFEVWGTAQANNQFASCGSTGWGSTGTFHMDITFIDS